MYNSSCVESRPPPKNVQMIYRINVQSVVAFMYLAFDVPLFFISHVCCSVILFFTCMLFRYSFLHMYAVPLFFFSHVCCSVILFFTCMLFRYSFFTCMLFRFSFFHMYAVPLFYHAVFASFVLCYSIPCLFHTW